MINKINGPDAVPKTRWTILKRFNYNKNNTEIPYFLTDNFIPIFHTQICVTIIIVPLRLVFEGSRFKRKFPGTWRKEKVVSIYKKEDTSLLKAIFIYG